MSTDEITPKLCPICSVPPVAIFRPMFHYARNTSIAAGSDRWFWRGCVHVPVTGPHAREEIEPIVERWNTEAEKLFASKTATWTDEQRDRLRASLDEANATF